jgi:hypothetical protein
MWEAGRKSGLLLNKMLACGIICLCSCGNFSERMTRIEESIESSYPQVKSVNILQQDGWISSGDVNMQIVFQDGNWILVYEVRYDKILDPKNPQNIWIDACNGYDVVSYYYKSLYWEKIYGMRSHELGQEVNKPLNNLDDVINNYETICKYVEGLQCFDNFEDFKWSYGVVLLPDDPSSYVDDIPVEGVVVRFRYPVNETALKDWVK